MGVRVATILLSMAVASVAVSGPMLPIPAGQYAPLFSQEKKKVRVKSFELDVYPVTHAEFLEFVKTHPEWERGRVKRLFAEIKYLEHWKGPVELGTIDPLSPVTNVSWFAARAYCEAEAKRLPTLDEWEYAALSDQADRTILEWYGRPTPPRLPPVGSTFKTRCGIYDMHGLIWEWVDDFNSVLLTGESRGDTGLNRDLFCAGGASGAGDVENYAAFMRYAFRGSLKARYTLSNLGFRCARTTGKDP